MWNPSNPFYWDMMAAIEETDVQQTGGVSGGEFSGGQQHVTPPPVMAPQQYGGSQAVKLPEFWPHAPGLWFARAECRFEMMGVASQRQKFCIVTDALPYESMRLVADLVAAPPALEPYAVLKDRLMMAHALSPVQKAEKLFAMPQLGARRPSDLLAAMFEFCPDGEEGSALFKALFLTRLPAEVRVHLEMEESMSLKQLAARADQLWLTLAAKQQAVVAAQVEKAEAVGEQEAAVAAVRPRFFKKKRPTAAASDGAASAAGGGQAAQPNKKLVAMQLCWRHAKYGSKAYGCVDTASCQWPEN
jgi:hypothetical protein